MKTEGERSDVQERGRLVGTRLILLLKGPGASVALPLKLMEGRFESR